MTENTALWDKLGKTDPKHTKKFKRAGGFEGTAIKPMFSYRRMTEEFGPCGIGWGVGEPQFQVVPGVNSEVMVFCTVGIWYSITNQPTPEAKEAGMAPLYSAAHTVYGVGGDKIVSHIKANEKYNRAERWENDDEAFKKAYTDAVTNALKLIGVGADVHMGLFDDSKYVNTMTAEFNGEEAPQKPVTASKNDDARNLYSTLEAAMRMATTKAELRTWWQNPTNVTARNRLPSDWQGTLREESIKLANELPEGHQEQAA